MSTPALAAVFLGLAAACYILGLWVNHAELRDCRLELAEARREAKKYQLALQSCRRRAHRGRLLAQLLREDER